MKKILLITFATLALLPLAPAAQASPEETKNVSATIAAMCKDKEVRMMMLQELTCTRERKMEMAKKLKEDPEFREIYDTGALDRS